MKVKRKRNKGKEMHHISLSFDPAVIYSLSFVLAVNVGFGLAHRPKRCIIGIE
jgi:hypothetical protein